MAYDPGLADLWRDDLNDTPGIVEKRMFGGLCFMLRGNMLCGVHKNGGMARVGKDAGATALSIDGVQPMDFTGKPMAGFIDLTDEAMADDTRRRQVLELALAFNATLPAK